MVQRTSKKEQDRGGNDLLQEDCPISRRRETNVLRFRGSTKNIDAQLVRLAAGRYVLGKQNYVHAGGRTVNICQRKSGVIPWPKLEEGQGTYSTGK